MYTGFTTRFRCGGLHEKHVVATWHLGYHLSICSWTQENQEKPASRWPLAGPSGLCPLDSSPVTNVIKNHMAHTHNTITLRFTTINTITKMQWKITIRMENQQQLPTILSKAINLKRQRNLNTTKTNLPTTRRI